MTTPSDTSSQTEKVVRVTITEKHKWWRLDLRFLDFIKNLRFDAVFRKRWQYQMWVYFAFLCQGLLGLLTLTLYTRNLTARPSGYLAAQRSRCSAVLREEKNMKAAKETNEEYVSDTKVFQSEDEEIDDFMERFTKKKVYDASGRLVKD